MLGFSVHSLNVHMNSSVDNYFEVVHPKHIL